MVVPARAWGLPSSPLRLGSVWRALVPTLGLGAATTASPVRSRGSWARPGLWPQLSPSADALALLPLPQPS